MPIKDDLLIKGYLPENMPPCFETEELGNYLAGQTNQFSHRDRPVRSAPYSASKRGMSRREFSFIHPETAHDIAQFISSRETDLNNFLAQSPFSLSRPVHTPDGDRAVSIASHSTLENEKLARLSGYRFVARTDISRFYHSVYTHSVPWAVHGKAAAKADRNARSAAIWCNRLDFILRNGQDGQTIGIPVGPDSSRYVAEIIGTAIDQEFINRGGHENCDVLRHVDDIWIGGDTYADVESALWRYRESIRAFELDINDNKTAIYSENFSFCDVWPSDITAKFEFAMSSVDWRITERLRAAFEYAFSLAAQNNDDGILKYTLRYIDRTTLAATHWNIVEPFLKRSAAHYGHTMDYVARIIVWRHLVYNDLNVANWEAILLAVLDRHSRLGNDAEVSWALYAAIRLEISIPEEISRLIVENSGPTSVLATLSCVEQGLVGPAVFDVASQVIATENGNGKYWPLILEWHSREWPRAAEINIDNDLIEQLVEEEVTLFDAGRLPSVFQDIEEDDFDTVEFAIEERTSQYDGEDEGEDDEPPPPF